MIIDEVWEIPIYTGFLSLRIEDSPFAITKCDRYEHTGHPEDDIVEFALATDCLLFYHLSGKKMRCNQIALVWSSDITHGVIAHEVSHAVFHILDERGLSHTSESDEAYAYLVGWITNLVYRVLKENKLEVSYA